MTAFVTFLDPAEFFELLKDYADNLAAGLAKVARGGAIVLL